MIFYIDNKAEQKEEVNYEQLIKGFLANQQAYTNFL